MDSNANAVELLESYREAIRRKSSRSLEAWQKNRTVMPGGVGSRFRMSDPFPMVVKEARGARLWDMDGIEYLDCMLAFSTMILGNADPAVQEAVRAVLARGSSYALCHDREYEFAQLFCQMVPGADQVAFVNSGTEATLYATRLARATTGRPLVAKCEGGYHGTHDFLAVSIQKPRTDPAACGPIEDPVAVPDYPGFVADAWKNTIILPYNHPAAVDKIRRHGSRLAAVIVEPVQGGGGSIPAQREFLRELRKVTEEVGALLIFDEVITGFRLARGGGQEFYGVIPDLCTFGKVPGGGMPIGALAGKRGFLKLMEYDTNPTGTILVGGTFNGNPITVAAGFATLKQLNADPGIYVRLNAMGDRYRRELNEFARENDLPAVAVGAGSIIWMHTVREPVNSNRDLRGENAMAAAGLKLLYRLKNLHISSYHGFLSAAHTDDDVTRLIDIHKDAMWELRKHGIW
jgi:glutamate-1-semialdehyde 2,1-aminomutase